ncbi:hypothetical protein [Tardiphaga sp.]|uniref:hypothetical protein n=1 Tax=Tardiphaga sp. TaxID=1926292 RepID=UPI00352A2E88
MNMMTSAAAITANAKKITPKGRTILQLINDHKAAIAATDVALHRYSDMEETIPADRRQGDLHCRVVTEVATDDPRWTAACHSFNNCFNHADEIALAMLNAPICSLSELAALMAYAGERIEQGHLWPERVKQTPDEEDPKDWIELVLIKAAKTLRILNRDAPATKDSAGVDNTRMCRAFSALEPDLRDLARHTRLAVNQLHSAVGDLRCSGGEYIEVPNYEATDLAIFVVGQAADAAKNLEALYDRLWDDAARDM